MKLQILTYGANDDVTDRMDAAKRLMGDRAAQGLSVLMVHFSTATARRLSTELGVPAVSTHTLGYTSVDADCIVLLDGDIIEKKTADRLTQLGKDTYVLVPQGALPDANAGLPLKELLKNTELVPFLRGDEEYPRTFACHHNAETCISCEWLVMQWKADRRDKAASS